MVVKTHQMLWGILITLNIFHNREDICLSSWKKCIFHIHTYLSIYKFLRASSFLDLYNSFIRYTNIISNQNMCFTVKKVCNKLLTTHWSYKCTNIRSGWLDRVIGWPIEVSVFCHPGDNSERLRYCSTEYGKGLKSATNIWHYLPKARMHGFGNQGMKVKMAHITERIIYSFLSILDSLDLEYLSTFI